MQNVARAAAVILAVVAAVNAVYMLVSPKAWFRLPRWLAARGVLTEKKYGTGWRAIQIRILGAVILFFFLGISYDIMSELVKK